MEVRFTIPNRPITKKNHSRVVRNGGRVIVLPSKQYQEYEEMAGYYIPCKWCLLDFPVTVSVKYYMPTKHRVDLVNLLEATCDILVHYGVIKDDNSNIVVSHDGSRVFYDKEHPRADVTISWEG